MITDSIQGLHTPSSHEPEFFSAQISRARRFYLDLNPSASEQMVVVSGGAEHCRPDYHISRPGLRYFSIEFVAAGEGALKLKNREYRLSAGDIFAYGPNIPHDIQCHHDRPLVKYFVDFSGKKAMRLLQTALSGPGKLVQTMAPYDIRRLMDEQSV